MSNVVFLLGAGFNLSVIGADRPGSEPPLSRTFFQTLIRSGRLLERLEAIRGRIYVDQLLEEIKRYWHLSLDDLAGVPFDIGECLTLLESLAADHAAANRQLELERASFALRSLLLMYLSEMGLAASSPAGMAFGQSVLAQQADVITLNYDTIAESCMELASGVSSGPMPSTVHHATLPAEVVDEDLDASHFNWKRTLAYGFPFDEVAIPVAGVPMFIPGDRYYGRPSNALYSTVRVIKLHGSIDWLRYTGERLFPTPPSPDDPKPPLGLLLDRHPSYWMGGPAEHSSWLMEPRIIPPILYKNYAEHPFPSVWEAALRSLSKCRSLCIIGYSFPPTDFRVRRLFLEAFSDHSLETLTVVDPNGGVLDAARELTRFQGAATTAKGLPSLYGLPASWFDYAATQGPTVETVEDTDIESG